MSSSSSSPNLDLHGIVRVADADGRKMTQVEEILTLEYLGDDTFKGLSLYSSYTRIFGGQTIGQALMAAYHTVDEKYICNSLHSYFLGAGRTEHPTIYKVERIRQGRSFASRLVRGYQQGKIIYVMVVSFHVLEGGFEFQRGVMPANLPNPEDIPIETETYRVLVDTHPNPPKILTNYVKRLEKNPFPVMIKDVMTDRMMRKIQGEPMEGAQQHWMKSLGAMCDEVAFHHAAAAFMSDAAFLATAIFPYGESFFMGRVQGASLDHTIRFHAPFRSDQYNLHEMKVQRNNNAIGFCTGQFFNRQGQVIMSTSQEGLIRQRNMGYKKNHVIVPVPLTAQGSTSASARTHAQGQTAAAASGSDTCANNHNHRLKSSPPASPTVLRSKL